MSDPVAIHAIEVCAATIARSIRDPEGRTEVTYPCADCGAPLTDVEWKRCAACNRKRRAIFSKMAPEEIDA